VGAIMANFSNLTAADILEFEVAEEEEKARAQARADASAGKLNAFKALMGQSQTATGGVVGSRGPGAAALRSYASGREKEIEGLIHGELAAAIKLETVKDIDTFNTWYTGKSYPAIYRDSARQYLTSYMQERRAGDPYKDAGTLWKPGTDESKQFQNKKEEYKIRGEGYTVTSPTDQYANVGTLWDSQGNSKTYNNNEEKLSIMDDGFNRTSPDAGYEVGTLWNRDTGASANYTTREQEVLLRQRGYKYTSPKSTTADPLKVVYDSGKKRVVWRLDSVIKAKNAETEDYYLPVSSDKGVNNSFVMAGILADIPLEFIQRYQRTGLSGLDIKMSEEDLKTLKKWIEAYSKDINKWHAIGKLLDNPIGDITVGG
jgi:hypothetical protein